MKILIIGKNGQLGRSFKKKFLENTKDEYIFSDRSELDLRDSANIESYFNQNNFDIIINCAAYTAVDKAELKADLANQVNHLAVKQIAEIAKQQGAKFIHVSTDYVFDGINYKPYVETDTVNPQNTYGSTKLAGERAIQEVMRKDATIIRTSWLYSEFGNNFVKTMLKLGIDNKEIKVVFDQIGTPTYASDLAQAIVGIIKSKYLQNKEQQTQIFHYSNEGVCSWYDFSKAIFDIEKIACKAVPIESKEWKMPAKRPYYTVLNKNKFKTTFEVEVPYWRESLQVCLKHIKPSDE
jgi:dTDP-4-dehydrorhamnose reductase